MQSGFYANAGGMVTQFNRLDVISNNLANINTNGFKRDDVVIGDFMRLFQEKRDDLPLENHTKEGAQYLNRSIVRVPHIVEEYTKHDLGGFAKTDNPLDVALQQENTFFAVNTPTGVRFSRDGSFSMNDAGELVNKQGFQVLPKNYFENREPLVLPIDKDFSIDASGSIYTIDQADLTQTPELNAIMVVRFDNIKYLQKDGNNLFTTDRTPTLEEGGNLMLQGFIEKSNVNPIREMTALIETNRLVGMYQKVMDSQMNDLNSDAINKLASIRG
jgi:flagellar basal-body rod protein FlgF